MQLIMSPTSPYARKVRIALREKDLPFEPVVDIPWNDDTHVPDFNPLGKIPVLRLDDGSMLYDSRVIVQYLEQIRPAPALLPADAAARIAVLRWEALADGLVDAAVAVFLERKRPAAMQDNAWIARQQGKIARALAAMERDLAGRRWCVEDGFSLADIAVGCALGYLDLRLPQPWREAHPALAALCARLDERPAFAETVPPQ